MRGRMFQVADVVVFTFFTLLSWGLMFHLLKLRTEGWDELPEYLHRGAILLSLPVAVPGGGLAWLLFRIFFPWR